MVMGDEQDIKKAAPYIIWKYLGAFIFSPQIVLYEPWHDCLFKIRIKRTNYICQLILDLLLSIDFKLNFPG